MFKFAVLPYCNAAPLVYFLSEFCPFASFVEKYPCETVRELKSNKVDAALIPIVDFLSDNTLKMVPGIGICAKGSVESVLLQSAKPFDKIRSIRLFSESKTTNMLIKVLISQYFGDNHNIYFTTENIATDAYIIIGDKALKGTNLEYTYDLSQLWYERTNLPFVFAVWAYKAGSSEISSIESIFSQSKEKGVSNIQLLSRVYAEKLQLTPSYIEHYLTDCLYYDIGPQEIESISRFDELINKINEKETVIQMRSIFPCKKGTHEGIRQLYTGEGSPVR